MNLGLEGRVALVTASSKGLGRATAEALAAEGARVAICARGEDALREAEKRLGESGADVLALVDDVTEPAAPARLVAATVERFGRLDVLVANAGGPPPARALETDDERLLAALNDNLLTSVRLVREAVPHMRAGGWGRICLIASYYVRQPAGHLALSNTARTGLWAWAKTAAADLAGDGVTLNLALPGPHRTDRMRALGASKDDRMGDPADFGRVVAFLCSEPAGYVSGAALTVDGAATSALS
ncbi:MAG TPA: SDR family oxidoreductase [Acidimicrobiales bacterium]|nr:SDR family oxidoreductase [Acidimicrobiales bacterium]